jgi:hypothetical protein
MDSVVFLRHKPDCRGLVVIAMVAGDSNNVTGLSFTEMIFGGGAVLGRYAGSHSRGVLIGLNERGVNRTGLIANLWVERRVRM